MPLQIFPYKPNQQSKESTYKYHANKLPSDRGKAVEDANLKRTVEWNCIVGHCDHKTLANQESFSIASEYVQGPASRGCFQLHDCVVQRRRVYFLVRAYNLFFYAYMKNEVNCLSTHCFILSLAGCHSCAMAEQAMELKCCDNLKNFFRTR